MLVAEILMKAMEAVEEVYGVGEEDVAKAGDGCHYCNRVNMVVECIVNYIETEGSCF